MELIKACSNRDIEQVKKILDSDRRPNYQYNNGLTGLMFASMLGYIEIVELLLATGESHSGYHPGCHPESRNEYGNTALILASRNGRTKIVELLLATGESHPEDHNEGNKTALIYAQENGYTEIVKLIENYRPFEAKFAGKRK